MPPTAMTSIGLSVVKALVGRLAPPHRSLPQTWFAYVTGDSSSSLGTRYLVAAAAAVCAVVSAA